MSGSFQCSGRTSALEGSPYSYEEVIVPTLVVPSLMGDSASDLREFRFVDRERSSCFEGLSRNHSGGKYHSVYFGGGQSYERVPASGTRGTEKPSF